MKKLGLAVAIIFVSFPFFILFAMIAKPLGIHGVSVLIVFILVSVFSSAGLILSALRPQPEPQPHNQTTITIQGNTITITRG